MPWSEYRKRYAKLTEKSDVPVEVRDLQNPAPETYRETRLKFNDPLRKFQKDIKKGNDHPSTSTRIGLPKYLASHPEMGNTENFKLRIKGY